MVSKDFQEENSTDNPSPSSDLLEKFVQQLTDLTQSRHEKAREINAEFFQTVADVKSTAEDILQHFVHLKKEISEEVDSRLQGAVEETLDLAIADTLEMKKALDKSTEEIPGSLLEGSWTEQIARWVRMYSRWKEKKEIKRLVIKNLAQKIDTLIEKDLQFIEQYQKQSLAHFENDPSVKEDLKNRIQYHLDEPLRKLKALKKSPKSFEEAGQWSEKIYKKRGSYLDTVLQKIENIIEEEAPFVKEPTDQVHSVELEAEFHFLQKEVEYVLAQIPLIDRNHPEQMAYVEKNLEELEGYIGELLESLPERSDMRKRMEHLLKKLSEAL